MTEQKGTFFAYSWHIDKKETNYTWIRIYGINEENENICLHIRDYTPYVYLELPDHMLWDESKAQLICSKLNDILENQDGDHRPLKMKLMFKRKLYYASLDKNGKHRLFPFLFLSFNTTEDIRILSYKLNRPLLIQGLGNIKLKLHENNASPILQLSSLRKIPITCWIDFIGKELKEDKITHCKHEYRVKWKNLFPNKRDTISSPYIMGYDIEVNSSIPTTMPDFNRPEDKIFQISCIFTRQGNKEDKYEKYLLTLGDPDSDIVGKDVEILMFDLESDLLQGFTNLILEKDPNIIIGYNIFGFDIPYMINRSRVLYCDSTFSKQSMIIDEKCETKEIKWSSSAYGNQSFFFMDTEGRIFVDLFPIIKRDYKLSNYSLKTVSAHFLKGATKDPLDAQGIFKCYRIGMKGGKKGSKALGIVGKYCIQDSVLVVKLFEILTCWVALCEMSKVTNVPIFQLYTQGQQLKVFSQVYRKGVSDNIVIQRDGYITKESDRYIGATIFPPKPGVYNVVAPFDFSSLYPTTIIAYNICWSTLVQDDSIPDNMCHVMSWEEHLGCDHDPKMIRKKELDVIIAEKMSEIKELRKLRDTSSKSEKTKYNEIIKKYMNAIKPYREERSIIQKSKPKFIFCSIRKYRWLKKPIGVLPEILTHLLDTRAATKKQMKSVKKELENIKDDEKRNELTTYLDVLDQRQLALKISANSAYGSMGVRKGYLAFMPGAMCTTFKGREAIEKAAKSITEDHKGELVYGDTDSNYVRFPHINNSTECWDYCIKVAAEVTKLFPKPMSLAFEEKLYLKFLILAKKRYMSIACERNGIPDNKISKKGVLLQRRDNCPFVRKIYGDIIMMIFDQKDSVMIFDFVLSEFNKLCSGYYHAVDFVITKGVGEISREPTKGTNDQGKECYKLGDYTIKLLPYNKEEREKKFEKKNYNYFSCDCKGEGLCLACYEYYLSQLPAHIQLAEKMRMRGQYVPTGTRLEYIITTNGGHTANQSLKIESLEYYNDHKCSYNIDYLYYLKQLVNPLDQVLNICNKDKIIPKGFTAEQYKLRLQKQKVIDQIKKINAPILNFI